MAICKTTKRQSSKGRAISWAVIENEKLRITRHTRLAARTWASVVSGGVSDRSYRVVRCLVTWLLLLCVLTACGTPRPTQLTGPGGIVMGEPVAAVETDHPKWQLESTTPSPDGREARQYRDYHWSLASGWTHAAEHHVILYRSGAVDAWAEAP